jgi:hypothetical protein
MSTDIDYNIVSFDLEKCTIKIKWEAPEINALKNASEIKDETIYFNLCLSAKFFQK